MGVSDARKRSDPIADPTGESTFIMRNIWAPACLLQRTASRCPIVHSRHCPNSAVHHATLRAPFPQHRRVLLLLRAFLHPQNESWGN